MDVDDFSDAIVEVEESESETSEGPDEFEPDLVNFQTPAHLCSYMVSLIPAKYRRRSLVVEPTPGAGNMLAALDSAGFREVESPVGDFFRWRPSRQPTVVIGNPPWSPMAVAYDILDRCLTEFLPDMVIMLMPWLTLINSNRRTRMLVGYGLQRVIHMPRSIFPGIRAQSCLLVLEKGYRGDVVMDFY